MKDAMDETGEISKNIFFMVEIVNNLLMHYNFLE